MVAVVDGYTILKLFHVLFAIVWVGGGVAFNIFATRAVASGDGPRIATFAREAEFVGQRVFLPSAVLVLLFGIFATLKGHLGFTDTWILLGLIGIGFTIVTGST